MATSISYEKPSWSEGRIAGSYEWDSTYSKYADPLKDGQVLKPVPMLKLADAVTEGVYRKPSMVFSISKNSKNPEAAAQILNCLLNEPEGHRCVLARLAACLLRRLRAASGRQG